MPFMIQAFDYPDALERRMATREAHLDALNELKIQGKVLYAAAMLHDDGRMMGSVLFLDFATKHEVDIYLETEPYVLAKVWGKIDIIPCKPAPGF